MDTKLTIIIDGKKPEILFDFNDANLFFNFPESPKDSFIGVQENTTAFWSKDKVKTSITQEINGTVINFSHDNLIYDIIPMEISKDVIVEKIIENEFILRIGNHEICLKALGECHIDYNESTFLVKLLSADASIKIFISSENIMSALGYSISSGKLIVSPAQRLPEFILGIADNTGNQRQILYGMPLISTSVVNNAGVVTTQSPITMTIYIYSSQLLVPSGNVNVTLLTYMPNLLDTLQAPTKTSVTLMPHVNYHSNTTTYTFHTEDGINYTDGFVYFSVYVPCTIQRALPIRLQISASGRPLASNTSHYENPSAFSISEPIIIDDKNHNTKNNIKSSKRRKNTVETNVIES